VAALRRLPPGELARKVVHMGVGAIAFAMRFLGPAGSAACALGAVVFNLAVLPRVGGKRLWREVETGRGQALGILLYPVTVLLLILFFWRRLEVAAAVWGILAFGDGMASLIGMTLGNRKLPWNPRKSWAGTLAYLTFGGLGAGALLLWTASGRYGVAFAWSAAFAAATLAAALESLPEGLDDNLGVPLVTATPWFISDSAPALMVLEWRATPRFEPALKSQPCSSMRVITAPFGRCTGALKVAPPVVE